MKTIIKLLCVLTLVFGLSSCGYERIDAGYEGIKVNLYGDGKGVDDVSLVTGAVWYNPVTTAVYEYPTFVQTVDYPPFSINAKDGSSFTVDPTISLKIVDGKSPEVFKKYRKEDIVEVINTTLYNYVKNAFRIQLNNYTTDELVSKREEFSVGREVNCYYPTFTFIDDLCDAGGTFLGELKVLKERYPDAKYEIMVCHAVNIKGLVNLCNNFDRVIITNSYCDYGYKPSNNNLTVIDVCG